MNILHVNDRPGEYPASYYAATRSDLPPFPALQGEIEADVCVVGGGYVGLSTALHLAEKGLSAVLLEAHRVGFGASGRNGGQVGSGQKQDQGWLEATLGQGRARQLWDMAEDSKALVKSLITRHAMPVTWHPGVAVACYSDAETREAHSYTNRLRRDYGYEAVENLDRDGIRSLIGSEAFVGGTIDRSAGHIHPLNFAIGLARAAATAGARIFETSEVLSIEQGARPVVCTAQGRVRCGKVVLAGNGYLSGLNPKVSARVMPINNFIIATEPLGDRAEKILSQPVAVYDTKFVVNYWRLSEDNRLLFGGGESYGYRFPRDIQGTVMAPMLKVYPQLRGVKVTHAWGGTLAITTNRMPAFMRPAPNVLAASACSGHGVALSTLTGKILAETLAGQEAGFDLLADIPQMPFPGGAALRWPMLVLAMTWYSMRDRLGI